MDVGLEVKVYPDVDDELVESACDKDEDGEIAEDETDRDVVNRNVSETETSKLELKADDDGRLVPALVIVFVFGSGKSEGLDQTKVSDTKRRQRNGSPWT